MLYGKVRVGEIDEEQTGATRIPRVDSPFHGIDDPEISTHAVAGVHSLWDLSSAGDPEYVESLIEPEVGSHHRVLAESDRLVARRSKALGHGLERVGGDGIRAPC